MVFKIMVGVYSPDGRTMKFYYSVNEKTGSPLLCHSGVNDLIVLKVRKGYQREGTY